eukprot:m.173554 g.173554  ORF g.173554 m.173554 type:complete len:144 (-) comp18305_c1_seq2:343-774(-)
MGAEYSYSVRSLFYRDRFGMQPDEIGWLSSRMGLVALLSSFSAKYVMKLCGPSAVIVLGSTACALQNILTGSAHTKERLYALTWLNFLGGVTMRMSALFSAHVEQGKRDGLGSGEVSSLRNSCRPFLASGALSAAATAVYVLG